MTKSSIKLSSSIRESTNNFIISTGGTDYLVQRCDFKLFPLNKVVVEKVTEFQEVLIADTTTFGRVLFLDGDLQSSEYDEALYHEILVQPAMLFHEKPENILVVGTGEGATLREILKHKTASRVVAVDIDRDVVKLCEEHLPGWHEGKMSDPRVEHVFKDGFEYLRETDETFDVAIMDIVSDLDDGPAGDLYTPEFYQLVKGRIKPGGLVAIQGMMLSHLARESKCHLRLRNSVQQVFSRTYSYRASIPSFLSTWGFLLASDWLLPEQIEANNLENTIAQKEVGEKLKHLDGKAIEAAFTHNKALTALLNAG